MFTPLGLFKDVPCPQAGNCSLLTCIFSHQDVGVLNSGDSTLSKHTPRGNEPQGVPGVKRSKIVIENDGGPERCKSPRTTRKEETKDSTRKNRVSGDSNPTAQTTNLHSITRTVSPPPLREPQRQESSVGISPSVPARPPGGALNAAGLGPRQAPKETLNPRMIPKAPASHSVRSSIITKLHAAISALNDQIAKDQDGSTHPLVLSRDELVTMALDEEEKTAKYNPGIYANVIKLRILRLQKMSKQDWENEAITYLNMRYYKIEPNPASRKRGGISTGLNAKEEMAIAAQLVTSLAEKEQFGYVTKLPTNEEIASAKKGVEAAQGWEKCDRCGGRFQVFPGRRGDGTLATGGQCTYHPGRLIRPPRKPTDHITGQRNAYFPCCNEDVGTSAGCTKAEYHVFKISDAKRLAAVLQFEETPIQSDEGPQQPVCFDCEMAYTTLGMELIRLTALNWPKGEQLLDILVYPIGEILDLNSRYSGIWPEHYANAIPYGAPSRDTNSAASEGGEITEKPMQVVDSPAAARALLFKFLQPDTPLIGHAIENDLIACRIVHPTIIDTVLLYPHPKGLPIRFSLKYLSKKHLDQDIQTQEGKGHDSKEDATATGELVRVKAAEKWKVLKRQGWTIEGSKLIAPTGQGPGSTQAGSEPGPGIGQKRKNPG
jgi:hypothetical protein